MQLYLDDHVKSTPKDNFDNAFYRACTVRSATIQSKEANISAKCVVHFKVPPLYSNQQTGRTPRTTHGAGVAVFFDLPTSMAIVATNFPGWESTGTSRRLDITYLRPPVEGEDVLIESEVVQIGKRLATLRGVMKRECDGVLLATCQHDKYSKLTDAGGNPSLTIGVSVADKPHYSWNKELKL